MPTDAAFSDRQGRSTSSGTLSYSAGSLPGSQSPLATVSRLERAVKTPWKVRDEDAQVCSTMSALAPIRMADSARLVDSRALAV